MVRRQVDEYFDGLCLDCMDRSKAKAQTHDTGYWLYDDMQWGEWSRHCRSNHGQPTWYFSFLGRREDRDRWVEWQKANNKRASLYHPDNLHVPGSSDDGTE